MDVDDKAPTQDVGRWRITVEKVIEEVTAPDGYRLMEDGQETEEGFATRTLEMVKQRFSRPLQQTSAADRTALTNKLAGLVCLLVHPNQSTTCSRSSGQFRLPVLAACIAVVPKLLDGLVDEITPQVKIAVYKLLEKAVVHQKTLVQTEYVENLVVRGMCDANRSVRLAAGGVSLALAHMYQTSSPTPRSSISPLFDRFHALLDGTTAAVKATVKETIIVTIGAIARVEGFEVLGHVLCCLVAQLGRQNPVLKGNAYMALLTIARTRQKSAYSLVSPYLGDISPFVVSRMATEPALLVEFCRFISISPADFLSVNLHRILPPLFATCNGKVLELIGRELGKRPFTLYLNHSHDVVAHALLLEDDAGIQAALDFIVNQLRQAAESTAIDVHNVVKSCLTPLLAEMIIVMGDENENKAKLVSRLQKIEQFMQSSTRTTRSFTDDRLASFLNANILGLITYLNEMLQEVQGRKSAETKRHILRGLGAMIINIGPSVNNVAPQIMATMQTMLGIAEVSEATLDGWYKFLTTLSPEDVGPYVGPTTASFVALWPNFPESARIKARQCIDYIVLDLGKSLGKYLDDVIDMSSVPELEPLQEHVLDIRPECPPKEAFLRLLDRSSSDNVIVAMQAMKELKQYLMKAEDNFIREMSSGDVFDPLIGRAMTALLDNAARDGDEVETIRLLAYECIGILGALDPDRFELGQNDPRMFVLSNFQDEGEGIAFAIHLIQDVLVGAFRSTSDIKYQAHLAFAIQELLQFCKFTPALVGAGSSGSVPLKVRNRWNSLPKHILETVTPLLEARYRVQEKPLPHIQHPVYHNKPTYREWLQLWTAYLITRTSGPAAQRVFGCFRSAVRNKDVAVAHHILPHLIIHVLVSGDGSEAQNIRSELLAVLEDQVDPQSKSSVDKKLLSAQAVFSLMDHLSKWVRLMRQDISRKRADSRRSRLHMTDADSEEQVLRVDSVLSSIDQGLMAKAALQCKSFARSLMSFERQIVEMRERDARPTELQVYYEHLHEIYADLDEPDGMEGISTFILAPSLQHQIRQHESMGHWTSAQSCWEVRLQQEPDNIDSHLGLLRSLRNLGHYDTLRTHVRGVLTRHPDWQAKLAGYQVESAWMVGDWEEVRRVVEVSSEESPHVAVARVLLAMQTDDHSAIATSLAQARMFLGSTVTTSGSKGYQRAYESILDLHKIRELEMIYHTMSQTRQGTNQQVRNMIGALSTRLSARLDSTLPTFRAREPILSMRRTALGLLSPNRDKRVELEIGSSWLSSAKIARKASYWQTAYSAVLQAQHCHAPFVFTEGAKLTKASGEPLRALQELERSINLQQLSDQEVIDLTEEGDSSEVQAQVLLARWMNDSDRYDLSLVSKTFSNATELWPKWESGQFYLGRFHDECFKTLPLKDHKGRGIKMIYQTVKCFSRAIRYGSKYIYQTVPRILTLWLDLGENPKMVGTETLPRITTEVMKAIKGPCSHPRQWYTAFPQIVSRVGHSHKEIYNALSELIASVIQEYPKQALWLFVAVLKSKKAQRSSRGREILNRLRNNPASARTEVPGLINECENMINELLDLCDHKVADDERTLSMSKHFPGLRRLVPSRLIIPLQESLTASLPSTSASEATHQPFPLNPPTFQDFYDEIEVMRSLAKPRKITIRGNDGLVYMFLGKPRDDLRKDARMMDFNAIINKLLKANPESRRRQLHIRTYGVVTLNEECGFIQWVPNTLPLRPVLNKLYEARNIRPWVTDVYSRIRTLKDHEATELFVKDVLPRYPPVFHEWFIETFPEPSAWLASRSTYGRTAAVMSMVGFILGLGDRHCENILLDVNTGDVLHVDLNCLFERGKLLDVPEKVPFRLTQNVVDGFGVTGVEGVFRIACEITMQLLRDNKDTLMSVLDAFIHDPLNDFEEQRRKLEREKKTVKEAIDMRAVALKVALTPIDKKLKGIYTTGRERAEKETSTSSLVQIVIQEATDPTNLARMYQGWAAWH
ncbi:hypothetical protein GLOTRDRAFT_70000 [Gloeophyllum trabeum ATCC 11539]|uniref:non-specific serine/threonine protein kinase n=1 Tax=Gloeophyllum trabeum (strain ATCC 11539 / FP-39264 / Madison 617) TaxID=670483 RepID=S7QI90_GLOTA|nr:uncharacterized protein GLOTRDRAFT_70000 [Gloeophyllum trabeum ATCC 11539]EPQ58953.1 hypothetical protein GLOTRDRAFT_70000 [Gloeophyllum trabeum ATCC 11539]